MSPADVLAELRRRQRLHDAACFAEQEAANARVLAEHRAQRAVDVEVLRELVREPSMRIRE